MKTLNIILGSVALLVASNAVIRADTLLAGPLPVDAGVSTAFITCAVLNTSAFLQNENIEIDIYDANFVSVTDFICSNVPPTTSCQTTVGIQAGGPKSPFICRVFAGAAGDAPAPVRGSICGTVSPAGLPSNTYCLQALLNNGQSGGWTPSGGP